MECLSHCWNTFGKSARGMEWGNIRKHHLCLNLFSVAKIGYVETGRSQCGDDHAISTNDSTVEAGGRTRLERVGENK